VPLCSFIGLSLAPSLVHFLLAEDNRCLGFSSSKIAPTMKRFRTLLRLAGHEVPELAK